MYSSFNNISKIASDLWSVCLCVSVVRVCVFTCTFVCSHPHAKTLAYMYLSCYRDLCSGMKYLESKNVVHR